MVILWPYRRRLTVAGIAQVAGLLPLLALDTGRRYEEPVGQGDRDQQCRYTFQQLPTCAHAPFLEIQLRFSRGNDVTRDARLRQVVQDAIRGKVVKSRSRIELPVNR